MSGYEDPIVIRKVWELHDNERLSSYKIARIVKIPESTIGMWLRRRAHVERELARREQAAADEARRLALRQRMIGGGRGGKPPIPPEIVAAIRAAWEERIILVPGVIARKWMYADLAKMFGITKLAVHDVVTREGKYADREGRR